MRRLLKFLISNREGIFILFMIGMLLSAPWVASRVRTKPDQPVVIIKVFREVETCLYIAQNLIVWQGLSSTSKWESRFHSPCGSFNIGDTVSVKIEKALLTGDIPK
jgi:hypothetical protein